MLICWAERKVAMMKKGTVLVGALALVVCGVFGADAQKGREKLDQIEASLKGDIPKILCLDEKFATGGQPSDTAFDKLAASGFRAVLNLRTSAEIDIDKQRGLVEKAGMRYIHIPVVSSAPRGEQVDEFLKAVRDPSNQPILIHCTAANRVGAFWMIYRAVDQNWPEEKALEEATKVGLSSPVLKAFAHEQIANRKK
jgi:uncharacterized protein (TIGR01244 family)